MSDREAVSVKAGVGDEWRRAKEKLPSGSETLVV